MIRRWYISMLVQQFNRVHLSLNCPAMDSLKAGNGELIIALSAVDRATIFVIRGKSISAVAINLTVWDRLE